MFAYLLFNVSNIGERIWVADNSIIDFFSLRN